LAITISINIIFIL